MSDLEVKEEIVECDDLQPSTTTETMLHSQPVSHVQPVPQLQLVESLQATSYPQPVAHSQPMENVQPVENSRPESRIQSVPHTQQSTSNLQSLSHPQPVIHSQPVRLQTAPPLQPVLLQMVQPVKPAVRLQTVPPLQPMLCLQTVPNVRPVSLVQSLPQFQLVVKTLQNPSDIQIVPYNKNANTNNQSEAEHLLVEKDKEKTELLNNREGSDPKPDSDEEMTESVEDKTDSSESDMEVKEEEESLNNLSSYESLDGDYVIFRDDSDDDDHDECKTRKKRKKSKKSDDEDYQPSGGENEIESDDNDDVVDDDDSDCEGDDIYPCERKPLDELEPEVTVTTITEYSCTYCLLVYSNMDDAKSHIMTHYEYSCEDCDEKFLTDRQLNSHKRLSHKMEPPSNLLICLFSGCEHIEKSKEAILRHVQSAHEDEKSFICAWCSRSSRTLDQFKKHIKSVHYSSPGRKSDSTDCLCDTCGAAFPNPTCLKNHLRSAHLISGDSVLSGRLCNFCGLFFLNLTRHIPTHGIHNVSCTFKGCSAKFKTKNNMQTHYRNVHLGIRKHHCTFEGCTYTARNGIQMKGHIDMVHLNIRRFPCTWDGCDKSFFENKHLLVHMRIHSDIKPLSCDLCDYTCRQRAALNWHMNKKHGQETTGKNKNNASCQPVRGIPAINQGRKPGRKARGKKAKKSTE